MAEAVAAPVAKMVKKDSAMLIVLGVVTVIVGVLAMLAPMLAGAMVTLLVGLLLIAAGIARTIFAFKCRSWGKGILVFLLGLLTLLVGLFVAAKPAAGLLSLTLFLAAYLIVDGIIEIVEAFDLKPIQGWGWMLFGGIVSMLLGIMIWRGWPESSVLVIGILVGIKLIFAGWAMVGIGAAARGVASDAEDAVEAATGG